MIKEKIQSYFPKNANVEYHDNLAIFEVTSSQIAEIVGELHNQKKLSLKLVTATDERKEKGAFKIWYLFAVPGDDFFICPFIELKNTTEFPSLANIVPEILNYERRIQTFFGLVATDIPDNRPLILHENYPSNVFPLRKDFEWKTKLKEVTGKYEFQEVKGEGIYEIPVGPIHAGIIEPGHFRFSMAGESIVQLEPRLGYVHKGSEKLFEVLSLENKIRLSEKISGDSSFSHSLAFCQTVEKLAGTNVPKRALYLRTIFAELERLANHFGDIGAIMMDTGFSFGGAHGGRLREMMMQINEKITGSRFLRQVNVVGGVKKDITNENKDYLNKILKDISKDFEEVVDIAENSASVLNRLKGTGIISLEVANNQGTLGVAGRAVGVKHDTRVDHPYAAYAEVSMGQIPVEEDGDVNARFQIRLKEIRKSLEIIQESLQKIPEGESIVANITSLILQKSAYAVSMVEGWRGEIAYFVATDAQGNISRVFPRDPSFVNWSALGEAGLNNIIPDFPLINKSFNMSYTGNDL
ncbi:MAG: NADH-quinone oxidoreductase subunit C [Candidatus Magasanikbacteria bacterium]